jgi:hypothetical protein
MAEVVRNLATTLGPVSDRKQLSGVFVKHN